MMKDHDAAGDAILPAPTAILELLNSSDAPGAACAVLTPAIRARLREMEAGQILLVRTDDPTSLLDVQAWCDLTCNKLLATIEEDDDTLNFFIRKE